MRNYEICKRENIKNASLPNLIGLVLIDVKILEVPQGSDNFKQILLKLEINGSFIKWKTNADFWQAGIFSSSKFKEIE